MSNTVKSAFIFFAATMISKVLGFFRDVVIANVYGAGAISDAYFMSLNIITVAFIGLFCVAIQSTYMPIYTNIEKNDGRSKALEFTGNIINIIVIFSLVVVVFGWVFTEPLVKLFAMGFTGKTLELTIQLTRIVLFSVGLVSVTYILKSYLEIHNYFLITGLMSIPYNISIIISVYLSKNFGVGILGYGTVFAFLAQILFLIPFCCKKGFKYKLKFNLKDKNVKRMALAIVPILIGASANQVNSLVDKNLASTLAEGSLSALNYGYRLNIFVTGLFVASITSVMYPLFSKLGANKNIQKLKDNLSLSINAITLVTLPISVGAFILSEPIIRVLFESGEFDSSATVLSAQVLAFYAIGMLASGIRDIVVIVYYSLNDTKTPMKNSLLCVFFNIVFNLILIRYLKAPGLALGSSISAILAVCFLMYQLRKKIGHLNATNMIISFIKISFTSGIMAVVVLTVFEKLSATSELISLLVSVTAGAIVYIIIILMLKIDATDYFIDILKNRFKRNNVK